MFRYTFHKYFWKKKYKINFSEVKIYLYISSKSLFLDIEANTNFYKLVYE